jgi:hypothetical protein
MTIHPSFFWVVHCLVLVILYASSQGFHAFALLAMGCSNGYALFQHMSFQWTGAACSVHAEELVCVVLTVLDARLAWTAWGARIVVGAAWNLVAC